MLYLVLHWIVSAASVVATAYLIRGFEVKSFTTALFAAAIIGLANVVIWPVLMFLTLPLNLITLGLFTFVVNGVVLKICAALIPGFRIETWGAAIFGAIVLSLIGAGLHELLV